MNAASLLHDLAERHIHLSANGDRLRWEAPAEVDAVELVHTLKANKAELMALLADWNYLPAAPTEPFNREALDAIKAGNAVPVWSGVLNEWIWFVRDDTARKRLMAEGCKLAVYSLGELALVAGMDKQPLRDINAFKREFGANLETPV